LSQAQSQNQAPPEFIDVSYQTGVCRALELEPYGPLWLDLNQDANLDLIFMNHGKPPSLYVSHGGKAFWDQFPWSGLKMSEQYAQQQDRHGCAAGDFDNDGLVDLFISHGAHRGITLGVKRDELLRNNGDLTFTAMPDSSGVLNQDGRGRSGRWIDFDNDGWLDLHVENFKTPNRLYHNNGDGTFTDITAAVGLPEGRDVSAWSDLDHDGWLDHLTAPPLRLFRNDRGQRFMEVPGSGSEPIHGPRSVAFGDFDNDGWNDAFFTSNRAGANQLLRNNGHGFSAVSGEFGPDVALQDASAAWGDLDNDGDLDLVVTSTTGLLYFANFGGQLVAQSLAIDTVIEPGPGAELALADYNGDGTLDIAVHGTRRHYLLQNQTVDTKWLKILLTGTVSNRSGYGAVIWVMSGSRLLAFREYLGDMGGGLSRGCAPVHVGLGTQETVSVRVRWPSGQESIQHHVQANQVVHIVEKEN